MDDIVDDIERLFRYRKRELGKLLVGLVFIGGLGYLVARMAAYGWQKRGLSWQAAYGVADLLGVDPAVFFTVPVGMFMGLLAVIIRDRFKRFQGILLLVGTIAGGAALREFGVLVTVIEPSVPVALAFLAGAAVSIGLTVYPVYRNGIRPYRFTPAVWGLLLFTGCIVVIGGLEALLVYESPLVRADGGLVGQPFVFERIDGRTQVLLELAAGIALLFILREFLTYEAERDAIIIGPTGSGKTWLMSGLHYTVYRQVLEGGEDEALPSNANDQMLEHSRKLRHKDFHEFGPTEENELFPLKFQYLHGRIFPQTVTLYALDHAGELLTEITPEEEGYEPDHDSLQEAFESAEDIRGESEAKQVLSDFVYYADLIGMLLPMEDFSSGDATEADTRDRVDTDVYINKYRDLIQRFRREAPASERKQLFLIVSKADKVQKEFRRETGRWPDDDPAGFEEYVRDEYINSDNRHLGPLYEYPHIRAQRPYVTYYDTDPEDPYIDDGRGNIDPNLESDEHDPLRGATKVLNRLGRR